MTPKDHAIFTIGHSTHPIDAFIALLRQHGVTALADVRSSPYSRFNPQFNKDALVRELEVQGIKYVFLGRELGARTDDRSCYENGRVQYRRLALTEPFRDGIERVRKGSSKHRIALVCAEKEPLDCHRTLLVARALEEQGVEVRHILGDGRLEPHRDTLERLLKITGLAKDDLFWSGDERIAEALRRQEDKVVG